MVSKSYTVNECPKIADDDDESVKNVKMQNSEQMKRIDRYMLHITNEMVKMKPSKMFHGDNSLTSKYWSRSSIIRWNRECIDDAKNYWSLKQLIQLVIITFLFVVLGYFFISWLYPYSAPTTIHQQRTPDRDNLIIVNLPRNLSISNSSMTEEASTQINRLQKAEEFETSTTHQTSTDMNSHDEHVEEQPRDDDDALLLTKKYVERINFYTTSNEKLFSVKVSPTLPSIHKYIPTSELPIQNYANENSCQSTSLPLCQGKLSYDLTDPLLKWNLTNIEYQHFQHLLNSECSKRVSEFVCHMLEPECRPSRMKNLKPCRRICKGIFESCSHIIASSEVLTEFFDCNTYIESNDHTVCEDITRFSKRCFEDEFQCSDYSCIPTKWRCDNIRDCPTGEDEKDCKFCNYDEFKCVSDKKCISDKWFCDGVDDCDDGSDEIDCDIESEEDDRSILYFDEKDYEQNDNQDHNDSDGDRIVSTGDDVVPIFVNPNTTSGALAQPTTTAKAPKRFRSTMRKPTTTQKPPEETTQTTTTTTTMKHEKEIVKASTSPRTSHSSPCPEFELRCVDGLCITLDQICDKIQDCSDNSDELHCEY